MSQYLKDADQDSLISRLPKGKSTALELPSQITQWLFVFDPAGIVTFRALALLGCQPEAQQRAFDEANNDSHSSYSRAAFLDAVRLWPTTPAILREVTSNSQLGGCTVPKGAQVIIYTPFFHRDSERLEFPHQMATDIWLKKESAPELGLLPFSAGPAICPAHNLVPMVGSLMISQLLRKILVDLVAPSLDPKVLPGTLNHFEVKLRLTKRTTKRGRLGCDQRTKIISMPIQFVKNR